MSEKKVLLHKLPGIIVFLLVFFSIQVSFTSPETKSINNLIMTNPETGMFKLTIDADIGINPGSAKFVDNPSRLFFDLPDSILKYNNGRTKKIQVDSGDLKSIAISQFQVNPDIVRIVLYFKDGSESVLRNAVTTNVNGNRLIISYSKTTQTPRAAATKPPKATTKSPAKMTTTISRINKILYKSVGSKVDRFVFQSPGNFDDPDVKITENGATLNFHKTRFKIPAGYGDDFSIPVSSKVIDKVEVNNRQAGSVVFMHFDESSKSNTFNYKMDSPKDNELTFELTWSGDSAEPGISDIKSHTSKPTPQENEPTNLFQSSEGKPKPGTGSSISKIQYVPLSLGERFIITATGNFNPEIQNIRYPDRLSVKAMNTSVVLPKDADDKYQIKINGAMSRLMKVFQRKVDGICESSILFYYDTGENELVHYKFYQTETANVYHLDLIPCAFVADQNTTDKPDITLPSNIQETPSHTKIADVEKSDEVTPVVKSTQPPTHIDRISSVKTIQVADDDTKESLVSFKTPESEEKSSFKTVKIPPAADSLVNINTSNRPESTISKPEIRSLPCIRISHVEGEDEDTFHFTCDEPIRQYRYSVLNQPSRLVLEFHNMEIDFDSTEVGNIKYVDGNATEILRISDNDESGDWIQLHIYLKYPWDDIVCSLSRDFDADEIVTGTDLSFSIELKPLFR